LNGGNTRNKQGKGRGKAFIVFHSISASVDVHWAWRTPGGPCLGHEIVAHEMTAAVVDGSLDGTTLTPEAAGRCGLTGRPIVFVRAERDNLKRVIGQRPLQGLMRP